MTGCHKIALLSYSYRGKLRGQEQWQEVLSLLFPFRGRLKQQRTDWLRAFPPQHPTQSGSGAIARDSVTNRFNGVPLLGPNSMMEWLGWARAMSGPLISSRRRGEEEESN